MPPQGHRSGGCPPQREDVYCGLHGTPEAQEKYDRVIAEWLVTGRQTSLPSSTAGQTTSNDPTINELVLAYWGRHVTTYYVKHGKPTSEQDNIRQALRFVCRLYGSTPAVQFGPLTLKAVRVDMIKAGRCRTLINKDVGRIRGLFKWASGNEILPVTVYQALVTVPGLGKGRHPDVKEAEPVTPAPEEHVWAVHGVVPPQIQAMIELQWWTGMRPGEVVPVRGSSCRSGSPINSATTPGLVFASDLVWRRLVRSSGMRLWTPR